MIFYIYFWSPRVRQCECQLMRFNEMITLKDIFILRIVTVRWKEEKTGLTINWIRLKTHRTDYYSKINCGNFSRKEEMFSFTYVCLSRRNLCCFLFSYQKGCMKSFPSKKKIRSKPWRVLWEHLFRLFLRSVSVRVQKVSHKCRWTWDFKIRFFKKFSLAT